MKHPIIDNSPDLCKLWDEGYELEIRDGMLYVHSIPYLDSSRKVRRGTLVSSLNLSGEVTARPETHVADLIGGVPHNADGNQISQILNLLPEGVQPASATGARFSSKPPRGHYLDYYEKVTTYDAILSSQANVVDDSISAKTFQIRQSDEPDTPFHYSDSNSARAKIHPVSTKLKDLKIAIIGIGGTGSYLLDLICKTMVGEIHIFDGDYFSQHNAFRAPGAPSIDILKARPSKVEYFADIYSRMHKGIKPHPYKITADNVHELQGMNFAFIAIDHGKSRKLIVDYLTALGIPFIDVGMGIINSDGILLGHIRTTLSTPDKRDHVYNRINFDDGGENDYSTNIQIAELNALNATFAVIKWKKLFGIYHDSDQEFNSTFVINQSKAHNDDIRA